MFDLGQTDLNIFNRLPSAQGYAALVDGGYFGATGAHLQETLDPTTLSGSIWDKLNVTTLLSLPGYFVTPVPGSTDQPTAPAGDVVSFPDNPGLFPVPRGPDSWALPSGGTHRWYFGGVLTVDHLTLPVPSGEPDTLQIGLVTPSGSVRWIAAGRGTDPGTGGGRSREITLPTPTPAAGVVVRAGPTTTQVGIPTVVTAEAGEVALNGRMQAYVLPPHWVYTGTLAGFGCSTIPMRADGPVCGPPGGARYLPSTRCVPPHRTNMADNGSACTPRVR